MAKLALFADRAYFPLFKAGLAADAISLGTITIEGIAEYQKIDKLPEGPEKEQAKMRLLSNLMLTGAITILSIKTTHKEKLPELKNKTHLYIDTNAEEFTVRRFYEVDPGERIKDAQHGSIINKQGEYLKNPSAKSNQEIYDPKTFEIEVAGKKSGKFMYVIDLDDNIIMGSRMNRKMPHPMLIGGSNPKVKSAGIVHVVEGKIVKVDNSTGHFKTGPETLEVSREVFSRKLPKDCFSKNFEGFEEQK